MRFCDKLPKLRKENNLSQEQLADRLGVSRQAVSKWELGHSYPDMDKMIQMCNILNCTLDDLMDDGTIGNSSNNKFNINNYFQDILKFITRTYNMFCSMKWKEKLKCLTELIFIFFLLLFFGAMIRIVIDDFLFDLLLKIPTVGELFKSLLDSIFTVILVIIGLIIFLHLFKIRYLDYYITVEDSTIKDKIIETPIDKDDGIKYVEKAKEKIIIRDPKHSNFSFLNFFLKIIVLAMKCFSFFIGLFIILVFIFLAILLSMSVYNYLHGVIFIYCSIAFLGGLAFCYCLIEILYNFICSRKQNFRRIFIIFIISLLLVGFGSGLVVSTYLSFDYVGQLPESDYVVDKEKLVIKDDFRIISYGNNITYVIDNTVNDVNLSIKHLKNIDYYIHHDDDNNYFIYEDFNMFNAYKTLINSLKNSQSYDYGKISFMEIVVTVNENTYNRLIKYDYIS